MRVTAVHQFLPSLAPRDAIGAHILAAQAVLRGMGLHSEIYADRIHPEMAALARTFDTHGGRRRRGDMLLYHASIGSRVADYLAGRAEPRLLYYHNITPVGSVRRWEPALCAELAQGRRQLSEWAPATLHALAVSSFNESELIRLGYASTSVAPILFDCDAPDPGPHRKKTAALARARERGGADLLFVGRIVPNKAQHDLVRALYLYRRLYDPRARLHLVGMPASRAYRRALSGLVARLGLGDAVDLPGSVGPAELVAYYRNADVFVCLSEHEGFCVPLVEAMHHRVPIVAFAAAAVPETLGDAGVVLPAKDPLSVSVALARVLGDAALRTRLAGAQARRLGELSLLRTRAVFEGAVRRALAVAEGA